jgi:HSP20 family molecular chaperone IbpA
MALPVRRTEAGSQPLQRWEAKLHEGVLTVRVPKAQQERPSRIDVKAA